ncbi:MULTISPECIES: hypothetical protein [Sinorhizobium]|uniref:Uncharacterized protein n=2 Tax=Sinorhizobium TaxID=28105 RepID=A0A2S3YJ63_9HYPH|nr:MULTISPECIES: hypothetical protein [Sinorhizobium]AUX78115.1 hypothetical protein NXT3_CH03588 [Sinorhizobium fredii]PDT41203.1 hypothetical protein CO656_13660 [Sinorhizobium sp. FG01]PDT52068.1 hypothetical protein CO664_18530 [Sinorhizobium sp. NG07B]POH27031.1 hypothetical protein ATY31_23445 [Sinorhizobium americanum]POH27381.1 hypothetical protein ATY30_23020 [Sinorhizobium americanum]
MSKKTRRDDAHLQRLKTDFPDIYRALLAGEIGSARKAFVLAGIEPERTRIEKLKNSWAKATDAERDAFLIWLAAKGARPLAPRLTSPAPTSSDPRPAQTPIASGRYLLASTIAEIKAIMDRRRMTPEDVMQEMGCEAEGRALSGALARGASLRLSVIAALEAWLRANRR